MDWVGLLWAIAAVGTMLGFLCLICDAFFTLYFPRFNKVWRRIISIVVEMIVAWGIALTIVLPKCVTHEQKITLFVVTSMGIVIGWVFLFWKK